MSILCKKPLLLVVFLFVLFFRATQGFAADAATFSQDTPCAALIFYTQTDNATAPTPEAKARVASLLSMMQPYTEALRPYVDSNALIGQLFASLNMECRKDQGEDIGLAIRAVGQAAIDAVNRDLKAAGKADHLNYPSH